jgi:predicted mannosyl-3-phosphoglycerate phosphatase (HAD superfamily)
MCHSVLQESYDTALSVFDSELLDLKTTMKAAPAAAARAAATAAREELVKALQRVQDTMDVQLQARVAEQQTRQATAEKQRIEQERQREQDIQQALKAAITEYQTRMKRVMHVSESACIKSGDACMTKLAEAHLVSNLKQPTPSLCSVDSCVITGHRPQHM